MAASSIPPCCCKPPTASLQNPLTSRRRSTPSQISSGATTTGAPSSQVSARTRPNTRMTDAQWERRALRPGPAIWSAAAGPKPLTGKTSRPSIRSTRSPSTGTRRSSTRSPVSSNKTICRSRACPYKLRAAQASRLRLRANDAQSDFAAKWIVPQNKIILPRVEIERLQVSIGQREETRHRRVVRRKNAQLDIVPVHLGRALCHSDVLDDGVVFDQKHDRNLSGCDLMPLSAAIKLARLVINPRARRQVNLAALARFHQRGDEQIRAEHVLVVNRPCGRIIGVLEEERAQHRVAVRRRIFRLTDDVRH